MQYKAKETTVEMRGNSPIITHIHKIHRIEKIPISPGKVKECNPIEKSGDRLGELCRKSAESKWDNLNKNNSVFSNYEKE